jgi:hypothetical protein
MRYALVIRATSWAVGFVDSFEMVEVAVQRSMLQSELRYPAGCFAQKLGVADRIEELGGWGGAIH